MIDSLSIHKTYSSDQPIEQRLQNKYTQNVESKMPSLVEKSPIPNFRRFSVSIFTINPKKKLLDIWGINKKIHKCLMKTAPLLKKYYWN